MKKVFKTFNYFLIIFGILFTLVASQNHSGNIYIYILFSLIINLLFIYTLNTQSLFFEIFMATFIWLGFWFKYSFSLIYFDGIIYDSGPNTNMLNIDKAILASIVAISSIFFSFFIRRKLFKEKNYKIRDKSFFENLYLQNKNKTIFVFILVFCSIALFNLNFNIYQKGFIYKNEYSFFVSNFIKWMLLFGLTTFSCFLIYTEILRSQKISILLVVVIFSEMFLSYSSMLSRALIMNLSAITFSFSKYLDFIKNKKFFFSALISLIILMFLVNNYFSNHIRINYAQEIGLDIKIKENQNKILSSETDLLSKQNEKDITVQYKVSNDPSVRPDPVNMTAFVIINRWTGIDSMIAVSSSKKLSFDLFFQSLKEEKIINEKTFYETTFDVDYDGGKEVLFGNNRILKGNTLPGIISFLFYTGNLYFLFISLFVLMLILSFFEVLCKKLTNNNMIFASFISFIISFRLFNFGYAPSDTYLFVISIFLSVLFIYFLSIFNISFFDKSKKKQNM